jgi:putative addiction module component (TIGR02574 family)
MYAQSMQMTLEEVLRSALALEAQDRADLAAAMIDSLDPAVEHGAQGAWQLEIERRGMELESGATESVPWDVVRERLARAARG